MKTYQYITFLLVLMAIIMGNIPAGILVVLLAIFTVLVKGNNV